MTPLPNVHFVNGTGLNAPVAVINELFYGPSHRFIYDYRALSEMLTAIGFADIQRHEYRKGCDDRLLIDQPGHVSESPYVEARNP
jgi:carotenoid cleavage dioxygenase-like enzyme